MDQFLDPETDKKHQFLDPETDKKCQFLDGRPETDVMDQFLDPETDIMGEGNYILVFGNFDHSCFFCRGLPKPKYFGRNQEPTRKKVSVSVPGLTILEITGYWLGTWF